MNMDDHRKQDTDRDINSFVSPVVDHNEGSIEDQEHSFPWKLHMLLEDAERENFQQIVSWAEGGMAFKVHDSESFVRTIMPNYFDQTKYESFRRQLNLYGFTRVTRGTNRGTISHPYFTRRDRSLCRHIARKGKEDVSTLNTTGTTMENAETLDESSDEYRPLEQAQDLTKCPV
jgi:hypothetical protein